jgi:hypothetical protein
MVRRVVLACVVGALLVVGAAPADAASVPQGRFGIGDSIMLSGVEELSPLGYGVNAEVGRQFATGVEVARRLANHGKLPRVVVVHLGTNGPIAVDGCAELLEAVGNRQLFLVTVKVPRPWELPNNGALNACANAADRVHIIRWYPRASHHPEWFATDGYHLNVEGQAAFAQLIDQVVDATMAARRSARRAP